MQLVDSPESLDAVGDAPACAFARGLEDPVVAAVVEAWAIAGPQTDELARRPSAHIIGDRLELVLLIPDQSPHPLSVRIHAAGERMLVLAERQALAVLRQAAEEAGSVREAVVEMLLAAARSGEEVLDALEDASEQFEDAAGGYSASPQRRLLGRTRADLFRIQETQAAMHRLCSPEEQLAQELPKDLQRRLRRAATEFDANRSAAARLHTVLGDLLAEQGAVVNERLTLVATIFLPLTLATGFFGMNFAWMQERTGSLTAFVLLGIVVPAFATLLTLALVRFLTRSS
ncbi:CorA family divalent cation transporter [Brachybacterium sp. sponge]|uniref:CorA family divalent cation transporter n=1 Tax=Brachybacterium sp. sponge TaxID=1775432 RepID=UPI0007A5291E|nr:CorA family divalent cation transporter [Brachybacterium sp. sponge]